MNDEPQPSAIPWWHSPLAVKLLVSLVMQVIVLTPLAQKVSAVDVAAIVDLVLQLAALALGGYALVDRKRSKIQPLTFTTATADMTTRLAEQPTIPVTEIPK